MDLEVEASSTSKPRPLLTCSFCNQAAASLVDQAASPLHIPNALLDGRGGQWKSNFVKPCFELLLCLDEVLGENSPPVYASLKSVVYGALIAICSARRA